MGTLVQMNPSLKSPADNAGLWQALHDGIIQVDRHGPRTAHAGGKETTVSAIPVGFARRRKQPGPDARPSQSGPLFVIAGRALDVRGPGAGLGYGQQGRIEVGYDADLVLVDLELKAQVLEFPASHQVRLESLARAVAAGLARRDLGAVGTACFDAGRIRRRVVWAAKRSSITLEVATGRPIRRAGATTIAAPSGP